MFRHAPFRQPIHNHCLPMRSPVMHCALLCGLGLFSSAWAQPGASPGLSMEQAGELVAAGKFQQALKAYDELARTDSLRSDALAMRGQLKFLRLGEHEAGFADVQEAVELAPASLLALTTRGNMYLSLAMPDRALSDAQVALASASDGQDSSLVRSIAGLAQLQKRNFQSAYAHFAFCLAQDSLNTTALTNMATTLDELGRKEEAVNILLALDARMPGDMAVMSNIGFILSKMGRYGEALPWFDKCVRLVPKEAVPLNNRGYAKLMNGDIGGAIKDIERSLKLNPANSYAYRNLGLALQAKGQLNEACTAWESALRLGFTQAYGSEVKDLHDASCR